MVVPHVPQEIIDKIIDILAGDKRSLRSCSLVSKSWVDRGRPYLFTHVRLCSLYGLRRWSRVTPPRICHHVRFLCLVEDRVIWGVDWITPDVLKTISTSLPNLESLKLVDLDLTHSNQCAPFGCFSENLTSLTLFHSTLNTDTLLSFVWMFPKLDNLTLCDLKVTTSHISFPTPAALPSFRGKLTLSNINHQFASHVIAPFVNHPHPMAFRDVCIENCSFERQEDVRDLFLACRKTVRTVDIWEVFIRESHPSGLFY